MQSRLRTGVAAAVVLIASLTTSPGSLAGAVGSTNRTMAGVDGSIGCLSTTRCVAAGYTEHGVGQVTAVNNGVPGHVSVIPGTVGIDSISCPNRTGCIGVARTSNGEDAEFVSINADGVASGTKKVVTKTGDVVERIACVTLTTCETIGLDEFSTPAAFEIGTWNGTKLVVHRVAAPPTSTDTIVEANACFSTRCDVVGYIEHDTVLTGISIEVTGGDHFAVHTVAHDALYDVSCVSLTTCYADGFSSDGVVVKLVNGVLASSVTTTTSDFFGIGCVGTSCIVAGKELATAPSHAAYWGTIYVYSAGALSAPQVVELSSGFEDAVRVAGTYAAIGLAQSVNSEVTTGTV